VTIGHTLEEGRPVRLWTIARSWTRLGCLGFGGPPTHISLLRRMCVDERQWLDATAFEDGISVTNLLPGPASTQLAIYCAWRLRGAVGAVLGGICFILPGLIVILALSALLFAHHPPLGVLGAAASAAAAVPAIAVHAGSRLVPSSWARIGASERARARWIAYATLGALTAVAIAQALVLVLIACGIAECLLRRPARTGAGGSRLALAGAATHASAIGGSLALAWVALKVGALSYGGGFVIVPLMQHDAVSAYHWMTSAQFLDAVALGQVTPGPVVLTVAAVGYAASGLGGGVLATAVAFAPSFLFVIFGARHFDQLRSNLGVQAFLTGTGPAVIGAIVGSAIPLARGLHHPWQVPVLAGACVWLFLARRGVVSALLIAGGLGVVLALGGIAV
jgi:chromate transporter